MKPWVVERKREKTTHMYTHTLPWQEALDKSNLLPLPPYLKAEQANSWTVAEACQESGRVWTLHLAS